jgi:protein TonB
MRQRVVAMAVLFVTLVSTHVVAPAQTQAEHTRKIVSKVDPLYPDLARKMSIQGLVRLEVAVTATGRMRRAEVLGGNPLLAKSAMDAVDKWKWEPSSQETHEIVIINFRPE